MLYWSCITFHDAQLNTMTTANLYTSIILELSPGHRISHRGTIISLITPGQL